MCKFVNKSRSLFNKKNYNSNSKDFLTLVLHIGH